MEKTNRRNHEDWSWSLTYIHSESLSDGNTLPKSLKRIMVLKDVIQVECTTKGNIVSSLLSASQIWFYNFVTMPELMSFVESKRYATLKSTLLLSINIVVWLCGHHCRGPSSFTSCSFFFFLVLFASCSAWLMRGVWEDRTGLIDAKQPLGWQSDVVYINATLM